MKVLPLLSFVFDSTFSKFCTHRYRFSNWTLCTYTHKRMFNLSLLIVWVYVVVFFVVLFITEGFLNHFCIRSPDP